MTWEIVLALAFQSLGVIYGDIGTSPLYVFPSTFPHGIKDNTDVVGVLSIIYYTVTLLPLVKYVFIVLKANDNGKGGTFALYTLLCRNTKVGLSPTDEQNVDIQASSMTLKSVLENSLVAKYTLLTITMLSTSLVIGDGVLTPSISVLSAVGGLRTASSSVFTEGRVVWISVAILILLFSVQRFGTGKVGYIFAPIVSVWLVMNAGIGFYNLIKYDHTVIKAVNPWHIIDYFMRNGKEAWISLGGVVLCVTGAEALFADMGHFSVKSIQVSMSAVVYPALMLTYTGQASYLQLHKEDVTNTFYNSIPGPLYWPMFVIAVAAAIIASQAMISGTFSIIQQSLALECFPHVSVVHTSDKFEGQVYIPEVNYLIMAASVIVTLAFRTPQKIGNAYGIAVVFAEAITSSFMILVMLIIWKTNIFLVIAYMCLIMSVEMTYLTSVLYKFPHGGFFPVAFACLLLGIMLIWNYVYRKRYDYEVMNKVLPETVMELTSKGDFYRIPGMAIFYSDIQGIPLIFEHYVQNIHILQSVVVFASIKTLSVSTVQIDERFSFSRVGPRELYVFNCVASYGYMDVRNDDEPFEKLLVEKLKEFVRDAPIMIEAPHEDYIDNEEIEKWPSDVDHVVEMSPYIYNGEVEQEPLNSNEAELESEVKVINRAFRAGIVHMMGESEVSSSQGAGFGKRIVIDFAYNFIKRLSRQIDHKALDLPRERLLRVGMIYEV